MVLVSKPRKQAHKPAMGQRRPKWYIALAAGFLVTLLAGLLYTRPWHRSSAAWKHENFFRIVGLVDSGSQVGSGDWQFLKRLAEDPDPNMRQQAIGLMAHMGYTGRRDEILAIARAHMNDPDDPPRSSALIALWRLDDPLWRTKTQEWLNSPHELLRDTARTILEVNARKLRQRQSK